jgi:hypothetical protein
MRKVDEVAPKHARHDPRREESDPPPPREPAARPAVIENPTVRPTGEPIDLRELAVPSEPPAAPATPPSVPPAPSWAGEHALATPGDVAIEDAPVPSPATAATATAAGAAPDRAADEPAPPVSSRDPSRPRAAPSPGSHAFTNVDPRLETIEPAISAGDWAAIVKLLGTDDAAGRLPPNLGLLYALARKEAEHDDATAKHGSELTQLAIRCMAGLFGVPEQSPIALVLAKRLLRKNPVSWQQRPAPPAKVSVLFILLAIAIGSAVGWAISQGYVRFHWH